MNSKLIELGPHSKMTPHEALAFCQREEWSHVLIIGFHATGEGSLIMRSSHVSREFANWILDHAKLKIMDIT